MGCGEMKLHDYGVWLKVSYRDGSGVLYIKPEGYDVTMNVYFHAILIDGEIFDFWWSGVESSRGRFPNPLFPYKMAPPEIPGYFWEFDQAWGWVLCR